MLLTAVKDNYILLANMTKLEELYNVNVGIFIKLNMPLAFVVCLCIPSIFHDMFCYKKL